ncbi:MAG: hypothetical protein DRN07_03655 [Thermoplasmata archaeon]|nr:MAG: hypothetical protein DRN07_03655 [Thermoplasmata archaeon]
MRRKIVVYGMAVLLLMSTVGTIFLPPISADDNVSDTLAKTREIYNSHRYSGWYYKPNSYSELVSWYQTLESQYPNYIEVFKANEMYGTGTITGGYDAYYVRITNESLGFHKPEVLFLGGPHGDETVGTIGLYWFADWMMRYAFDPAYDNPQREWLRWLLDHREIYFEVCHNPYGFDYVQRYDGNGWDLNREADYDGPGSPTGGIWASVNGKTLRLFVDNHAIRVGCDIHGGTRMLLYPWADTHYSITGTSPISGETYNSAPPDFYFYDAEALRCGAFIGNLVGDGYFNENNVGTIGELIWYSVYGGIAPWAYGADVVQNPVEDPYVEDETFGNYPGAGILWISPEMSYTKNPPESDFGNDTVPGYGMEMRRFILHQIDIAQPYVQWMEGTTEHNTTINVGENVTLKWQVNGCLVVDHTSIQWGTHPDIINHSQYSTPDHDEHAGEYVGGTGWDNASNGVIDGTVYVENITINTPGTYYFVAKAQVDQIYNTTLAPSEYGTNHSYLRLVKERVNGSYFEMINGTDGNEVIEGHTWWYSPVIKVNVVEPTVSLNYTLYSGWNLITIPAENNYTASDLAALIPGCEMIAWWNAASGTYKTFIVGVTPPGSPYDFDIADGVGYYVKVAGDTHLVITNGTPLDSVNVTLYPGWNTIGWWSAVPTTASSLAGNITNCTMLAQWNAATSSYTTFLVGITPPGSPWDFTVERGMGFFVKVTSGSVWHGEG